MIHIRVDDSHGDQYDYQQTSDDVRGGGCERAAQIGYNLPMIMLALLAFGLAVAAHFFVGSFADPSAKGSSVALCRRFPRLFFLGRGTDDDLGFCAGHEINPRSAPLYFCLHPRLRLCFIFMSPARAWIETLTLLRVFWRCGLCRGAFLRQPSCRGIIFVAGYCIYCVSTAAHCRELIRRVCCGTNIITLLVKPSLIGLAPRPEIIYCAIGLISHFNLSSCCGAAAPVLCIDYIARCYHLSRANVRFLRFIHE